MALADGVAGSVGVALADGVAGPVGVALADGVAGSVGVALADGDGAADADDDGDVEGDGEGDGDVVEGDGEADGAGDDEPAADGCGDPEAGGPGFASAASWTATDIPETRRPTVTRPTAAIRARGEDVLVLLARRARLVRCGRRAGKRSGPPAWPGGTVISGTSPHCG